MTEHTHNFITKPLFIILLQISKCLIYYCDYYWFIVEKKIGMLHKKLIIKDVNFLGSMTSVGFSRKTKNKNKNNIKHPLCHSKIQKLLKCILWSKPLKISKKCNWFSHCLHHFMAPLCTVHPKTLFGKRHNSKYAKVESVVTYIHFLEDKAFEEKYLSLPRQIEESWDSSLHSWFPEWALCITKLLSWYLTSFGNCRF